MERLKRAAAQIRITNYKNSLQLHLVNKIIDVGKPEFADLVSSNGKPMESLNGQVFLGRDLRENGKLKGVFSVELEDLASMLPDIKVDTENKMGWKKHLDKWNAEGVNVLEGIADPTSDEYELPAAEELASLDIATMSDADTKQKLLELQQKLMQEQGA